ncbi:hypothetical protein CYMTET_16347, partial [Cymbomonas tetramitiformis]
VTPVDAMESVFEAASEAADALDLRTTILDEVQYDMAKSGRCHRSKDFVLRKLAEGGVAAQLVEAGVAAGAALRRWRSGGEQPLMSAGWKAQVELGNLLVYILQMLRQLANVPKLAKELGTSATVVELLDAALVSIPEADAFFIIRGDLGSQDEQELHSGAAGVFCSIAFALFPNLTWQAVTEVLNRGMMVTMVKECLISHRPREDIPGYVEYLAVRVVNELVFRIIFLKSRKPEERGAEAERMLAQIGTLCVFELSMNALARKQLWKHCDPELACMFVAPTCAQLLMGPAGCWSRLQENHDQTRRIEAVLKKLRHRTWAPVDGPLGIVDAQITPNASKLIGYMQAIRGGKTVPAQLQEVLENNALQVHRLERMHLKKCEKRLCSWCQVDETAMRDGQRLRKCAACDIAMYCSRECQVVDWKKGHKRTCVKI